MGIFRFVALLALYGCNRRQQNKKSPYHIFCDILHTKCFNVKLKLCKCFTTNIKNKLAHKHSSKANGLRKSLMRRESTGRLLEMRQLVTDSDGNYVEMWRNRINKHGKSSTEKRIEAEE